MRKKILSLFIVFLFVSFPFVSGAEIVKEEDFDEKDTGGSIAVNVRSYEPTILTSNLLEDGSVPVYIFLAGSTLGTLFQSSTNIEPVYGGIEIEKMRIKALNIETEELLDGDPKWYKPNKFDADTLGYLTVTLKQFDSDAFEICTTDNECDEGYTCETGACIPKEVNLSFSAEIWFTQAERLYSLSKSALILPIDSEEDAWVEKLDSYGSMYSFYGGRGLVRVKDISENGVDLTVYSNKDMYWPIIGSPRAIADVHLDKGETSDYIDLGFTDEQVLGNAKFRITLNGLKDPAQERAIVSVTINGAKSQVVVTEGASLYPGSTWTVKDMSVIEGRGGVEYILSLKDAKGNVKKIITSQGGLSEGESAILNTPFYESPSTEEDAFFYTANTKQIRATTFDALEDVFRQWVKLDVSDVAGDLTQTKMVTLQNGVTLKEVLLNILPPGYHYAVAENNVIEIKKFASEDPCLNAEIYGEEAFEEKLGSLSNEDRLDNTLKLALLCTGVSHFEEIIRSYDTEVYSPTGALVVDEAYLKLAQSYEEIADMDSLSTEQKQGAKEKILESYQKMVDKKSPLADAVVRGEIERLNNELLGDVTTGSAALEDNGQFISVQLLSLQELGQEQQSSAVLSRDGIQNTYHIGEALFSTLQEGKNTYNWYVYSISEDSVQIRRVYSSGSSKILSKSIELDGAAEIIEKSSFQVKRVDTKKEAYLTITPGTGEALRSISNFSVHIPIESRAFDLNPTKIDDQISKAKELQEKLDEIIETLEKIVKTWNYVCLGVFAYVSLKSSFLSASAQARHDAIHGVTNEGGWNAYCEEESSGAYSERQYKTYDECMLANAGAIDADIDAAQHALESVDESDNISSSPEIQELTSQYTNYEECEKLLGSQVFLDDASKKDYVYLKKLSESDISDLQKEDVQKKLDSYVGTQNEKIQDAKIAACNSVSQGVKNGNSLSEAEQKQMAIGVYERVYNENLGSGLQTDTSVKNLPALSKDKLNVEIVAVGRVFKGDTNKQFTVYQTESNVGKKVSVRAFSYNDYRKLLEDIIKDKGGKIEYSDEGNTKDVTGCSDQNLCAAYKNDLRTLDKIDDSTAQISSVSGAKYYWDGTTIYVGQAAYSSDTLNEKYAVGAKIEIYSSGEYKGLPYCLPHKNGNFIKFTEYTTINEIKTMQYWNVGNDGQLCTNDDILVAHESELHYDTASPSYTDLVSFANKWVKQNYYEGDVFPIDGHDFTVSYGKSKTVLDGATASCFDVMDPGDCKLLFNTCDPVMCPPSRFNLGGRYQVDNVVESGIIGSVVLPQGSGDTVPLCFTGILASLHFWKSMLDGYVECLETAKYEGKSVGVCDKVRSVYMCELIVREVAAITDNNKDGLLDFLANKAYGQEDLGGGEYFQFKENIQNVQNSVSYFTTEYATTAFAAFKGRSLEEIGTTICQQAIYAQTPWIGDFLDQVTTPEDPNQFYATLTVRPYAPSLGTNAYQTYYHLYAGVNPNIQNVVYSVYLKNSLTGEIFYTTEECEGVSSSLELGGMTDKTLDCLAPEGLDTVCVIMNGETHCGFGTVSTAFSYDYLKESLVADEVKRDIQTEKECYPSSSVASPTASSLATFGSTESLVLPYSYGELSTGVQRVCALQDPGIGQGGQGDWIAVGSCGKDTDGRELGKCWLNQDSYSIKDAEKNEKVQEHLETKNFQILKQGIENLMDAETSEKEYITLLATKKSDLSCVGYASLAGKMKDLYDRTLNYQYAAIAQYELGYIYYLIGSGAGNCAITGRTEIDYNAELDGHDLSSYGENDAIPAGKLIDEGEGMFEITFLHLQGNEMPVGVMEVGSEKLDVDCDLVAEGEYTCSTQIIFTQNDDVVDVTFTVERLGGSEFNRRFRFRAAEEEEGDGAFEDASKVCHENCGGLGGFGCKEKICHSISKACYFDTSIIDECFACEDIQKDDDYENDQERCAALKDDRDRCESSACYGKFLDSGKCIWKNDACSFDGVLKVKPSDEKLGEFSLPQDELVRFMRNIAEDKTTFGSRSCACGDDCEDYSEWIYDYSEANDLDPFLVLSIILQESSCTQKARSSSDCVGLMQICGTTSEEVCGVDASELNDDDEAESNIQCGAQILKKKYETYNDGKTYESTGVEYAGWLAAIRGYVGWGAGHEDYVEEVESIYDALRDLYDKEQGAPAGAALLVDKNPYLQIESVDESLLIEDAAVALEEVAGKLYEETGYALKVSSASRTVEEQARLFYTNCLTKRGYSCDPVTCDITGGKFKTYIDGFDIEDDKEKIIQNLADHGEVDNCAHTSLVAADIWCDDDGGNFQHDPLCQAYLTELMIGNGFCRIPNEAWHFEWKELKVSSSCSSSSTVSEAYTLDRGQNYYDPTEGGTCGLWDYSNHECISSCENEENHICESLGD